MVTANDEIVSIGDVAKLMKLSRGRVYHMWSEWADRGVRVLKITANGQPRFFKSDILKLMENGYKTKA